MGTYRNPLPPIGTSGNCSALLWLGATDFNAESTGRKAASLHSLLLAGLPIAPGFIAPPQLDVTGRGTELEAAVAALGGFPVAARSSSSLEDSEASSFAGQFTTCLFVTDIDGLQTAIEKCRQSVRTAKVSSYLRKRGLTERDAAPSVLVQRMVEARVAGVAFSIHPGTGREEHALVECCNGLADRLVSGQTIPTNYVLNLESGAVVERQAGNENVLLGTDVLRTLCDHLLVIQAHCGLPQDVEWALDRDGKIWILQSRPITRMHWRDDVDEFTNANFRDGGVSARVCTPFMYSLYRDAFQESMQQYFVAIKLLRSDAPPQTWIRMFYGRPYWSASAVKKALCKVPGFDEERFDGDVGIHKNYGNAGPIRTPRNLRTILPALPVAFALDREFRRQLCRTENYGQSFLPREAHYLQLLKSSDAMEDDEFFSLLVEVLRFHTRTDIDYLRTVYNHVNYQTEFKKLLDCIQAATGQAMAPLVLMSGLLDISHMKIQQGLLNLVRIAKRQGTASGEWDEALTEFLRTNYFHGDAQLDIGAPRWRECPDRIRQMVEGIQQSGIEPKQPEVTARKQFELYSEEVRRIRAVLQRSRWQRLRFEKFFCKRLKTSRTYASRREEMREYSMRADDLVRRYLLQAGRRLHRRGWLRQQADVFMLHTNEVKAIAYDRIGKEQILAASAFRELTYRGYRMVDPPGELGRAVSQHVSTGNVAELRDPTLLKGMGCSAGRVTAKARVLTALAESDSLLPGEILVTRFTDPAWTPIMGLVAGLITEVGGLLSHGAVIAREYGLPAVFNVPGATEIIKTGQVLEIDGTQGTAKIVNTSQSCYSSPHNSPMIKEGGSTAFLPQL